MCAQRRWRQVMFEQMASPAMLLGHLAKLLKFLVGDKLPRGRGCCPSSLFVNNGEG